MTEAIKWQELADKDKVKLILQHIFGCFIYEDEQRHEEIRGIDAHNAGFHYPHAYWDQGVERWCVEGVSSEPEMFEPLHNMNDAWKVVEKMKEGRWSLFCYTLDDVLTRHQRDWDDSTWRRYVTWFECFMKRLNAESVCIAALLACGVKIDREP